MTFENNILQRLKRFQTIVDAIHPDLGVEWHKASFMMEPRPGVQVLFIYSGTPGAFRAFIKTEQRHNGNHKRKDLYGKLSSLVHILERI